jgi:hypothetical protein
MDSLFIFLLSVEKIGKAITIVSKVGILKLVIILKRTPTLECYVVGCGSKNGYRKDTCLKKYWTTCSKYDTCSRLNNQHK